MIAERYQVKLFAREPDAVELEPFVPVFHRWIQQGTLDELVIDVADYSHVHDGPGILLVGHASDYYLDVDEGRPGLLYSRKRDAEGDGVERLVDALRRGINAAKLLQQEDELRDTVRFDTSELLVRIPDRLRVPNTADSYADLEPVLRQALERLYGDVPFSLKHEGESRQPFTVRVRAESGPELETALSRLN